MYGWKSLSGTKYVKEISVATEASWGISQASLLSRVLFLLMIFLQRIFVKWRQVLMMMMKFKLSLKKLNWKKLKKYGNFFKILGIHEFRCLSKRMMSLYTEVMKTQASSLSDSFAMNLPRSSAGIWKSETMWFFPSFLMDSLKVMRWGWISSSLIYNKIKFESYF